MLDLDITTLIQMVNFFIVLYVLNAMLIKPVRAILQERRDKMNGLSGDAEAFEREATDRLKAYEAELAKARNEGVALRDAARNEAATTQQDIMRKATATAQKELAKAQEELRLEAESTLNELKKNVSSLAEKLATKITN